MNETDTCPCGHTINWHTPTGCVHAADDALEPWTDCTCTAGWRPRWCPQSGLGLIDHGQLPNQREFLGRCTCGTVIPVTDGQIAYHRVFDEVTA